MEREGVVLHRFVALNDRLRSQQFSFLVTEQLVRGLLDRAYSAPFAYAQHRWRVCVERREPHLGVHLELLPPSTSATATSALSVTLDFVCRIQNREHFSRDESFEIRSAQFGGRGEKLIHGRTAFVELADLSSRRFLFDDGRCIIQVEMRNLAAWLQIEANPAQDPALKGPFGYQGAAQSTGQLVDAVGLNSLPVQLPRHAYLETSVFVHAGTDWRIVISMDLENTAAQSPHQQPTQQQQQQQQPRLSLEISFVRVDSQGRGASGNPSLHRVACSMELPGGFHTGDMEFLIGPQGWPTRGFRLQLPGQQSGSTVTLGQACLRGPLKLQVQLGRVTPISVVEVAPMPGGQTQGRQCSVLHDPEGFRWLMYAESGGRLLRLGLKPLGGAAGRYRPAVAARSTRCIGWTAEILPVGKRGAHPIRPVMQTLQQISYCDGQADLNEADTDEPLGCSEVAMNISMAEVCDSRSGILSPDTRMLTVHLEWLFGHVLLGSKYCAFDDITRLHRAQMKIELNKLQIENQQLERQLMALQLQTQGPPERRVQGHSDNCQPNALLSVYPHSASTSPSNRDRSAPASHLVLSGSIMRRSHGEDEFTNSRKDFSDSPNSPTASFHSFSLRERNRKSYNGHW